VNVEELVYLHLNWKSGLATTARYFTTTGEIVGDGPGVGDLAGALAEALGAWLGDAAAEGLEPVIAVRSTDDKSTLQCIPAAPAMSAAPAIQMPSSAEKATRPPNLLNDPCLSF